VYTKLQRQSVNCFVAPRPRPVYRLHVYRLIVIIVVDSRTSMTEVTSAYPSAAIV